MTRTLNALIEAVHREAKCADFPVDTAVYQRSDKDPTRPILYAGSLDAPVCVFARDLGKDEVAAGEPLIGAGGRLVRAGLYEAWHGEPPPKSDRRIEGALEHRAPDQHGPVQAAGEQGVRHVGQGAVPPLPGRAARRALEGRPRPDARDRGVPVVRPLCRRRRLRRLLEARGPLRGRSPLRPHVRDRRRARPQAADALPPAPPLAPESALVSPLPRPAREAAGGGPRPRDVTPSRRVRHPREGPESPDAGILRRPPLPVHVRGC